MRALRAVRVSRSAKAANLSGDTGAVTELGTAKGDMKLPAGNESRVCDRIERKQDIGTALFGGKSGDGLGRQSGSSNPFSTSTQPSTGNSIFNTSLASRPDSMSETNPFSRLPDSAEPAQKLVEPSRLAKTHDKSSEVSRLDQSEAELSASFAEKAQLTSPAQSSQLAQQSSSGQPHQKQEHIPWPKSAKMPKPYPKYYLDADYEYLDPISDDINDASGQSKHHAAFLDHSQSSDMDMDTDIDFAPSNANANARKPNNSSSKTTGKNAADKKEDAAVASMEDSQTDRTFQHFADTVAQNADQVLRYEFGGRPLLYSRIDAVGRLFFPHQAEEQPHSTSAVRATRISHGSRDRVPATTTEPQGPPSCPHCASTRLFEFQITPNAITELEAEQEAATILQEGMEWGTVLVCVCGDDCLGGSSGGEGKDTRYVEEWVGVQWEEVIKSRGR